MKKSLFLAVFFLCASCFYAVRLYKTKEIPFLDDAVEGFTEVIGYKPEVVQKKIEKKEQVIEKAKAIEKQVALAERATTLPEPEKKDDQKKDDLFGNIATTNELAQEIKEAQVAKEEEKKNPSSNLFGNIAADENETSANNETRIPFEVSVYKTQDVKNDGVVMLRLERELRIDQKSFPKGFVFEATTALNSGRLLLRSSKLGLPVLNYENGFEGQTIAKKWLVKKGEVTLSEGEKIILYY